MPRIDLDDLLRREDSHVERKQEAAQIDDVVKTLTAFANDLAGSGRGGWVLCGVKEGRDDHGFPVAHRVGLSSSRFKEIQGKVLDWCRTRVSPPLVPDVGEAEIPADPSRRILGFHVAASPYLHGFREENGSTRQWVRYDDRTVEARGELLRQLQRRKDGVPPFLQRPCPKSTLVDLDLVAAGEF
jgi:ATP-dependent DNA helicase RecG